MRRVVENEPLDIAAVGGVALQPVAAGNPDELEPALLLLVGDPQRRAELVGPLDGHLQELGQEPRGHGIGRDDENRFNGGGLGAPLGRERAHGVGSAARSWSSRLPVTSGTRSGPTVQRTVRVPKVETWSSSTSSCL